MKEGFGFIQVFNVNVKSQFFVAQQAYEHLNDHGRLILMSSLSAQRVFSTHSVRHFLSPICLLKGFTGHSIYGASKAAIQGMVRSLAYDFGPRHITVNCLAPGGIKTDMYGMNSLIFFFSRRSVGLSVCVYP